jgi:acetyl esterase
LTADEEVAMSSSGPQLEPSTQRFVDSLAAQGGPPLYTLQPQQARQVLTDLQSKPVTRLPAEIEDRMIPGGPGGQVSVRIVRPQGAREVLPAIVFIHGGGWILGDKDTHDRLIRELANGAHAAVVFVNYTPSPEAHFPVAIEQAYAVAKFVAEKGATMNIDPTRLALAGDSVGGNMVAALSLLAKQRGGPAFKHQVMFYPVTNARFDDASYREFADGPWLTKRGMQWFFDAYAPTPADRDKPTVSPLLASIEELAGQAPALIITDENDVLRDEGEAYAHKLMEAGVPVKAVRVLGTHHDFVMLNALAETPETRGAIELANRELANALHGDEKPAASRRK